MDKNNRVVYVILGIVVVAVTKLLWGLGQKPLSSKASTTSLAFASFFALNPTILREAEARFIKRIVVACCLLRFLKLAIAFLWFEDLVVALAQSVVLLFYLSLSDIGFTLASTLVVWFWATSYSSVVVVLDKWRILRYRTPELHSARAALAFGEAVVWRVSEWFLSFSVIILVPLVCRLRTIRIFIFGLAFRSESFNVSHIIGAWFYV